MAGRGIYTQRFINQYVNTCQSRVLSLNPQPFTRRPFILLFGFMAVVGLADARLLKRFRV